MYSWRNRGRAGFVLRVFIKTAPDDQAIPRHVVFDL